MTQYIKEQTLHACVINTPACQDDDTAYIRAETVEEENLWVIYDHEGEKLGHANSREMAFAVAYQNDLLPMDVH